MSSSRRLNTGVSSLGRAQVLTWSLMLSLVTIAASATAYGQGSSASSVPASTSEGAQGALSTRVSKKKYPGVIKFRWNMGLGYADYKTEKDTAQISTFNVGADLRYGFLKGLELKASAGVDLGSGHSQTRFGDYRPTTGINLREAVVRFRSEYGVTIQGGALEQRSLEAPLLVSGAPFPGLLEKIEVGGNLLKAELTAQQTIPTSVNLSSRTIESEATPSFLTETLQLSSTPARWLQVKGYGGHYAFHNLPSTVAFESSAFGNTVRDVGGLSSKFAYEFNGWFAGGGTKLLLSNRVAWKFDGQMLQNMKAPSSHRNGQMWTTGFELHLPGRVKIEPSGGMFFAESDLAPAYYNSADMGHSNREGWMADLMVTLKDSGLKFGGRYVDSDVINAGPIQIRQQYFKIVFETLYDVL